MRKEIKNPLNKINIVGDRVLVKPRKESIRSEDATHILKISAPKSFKISSGEITLPIDLDIFNPFPSTTNPCERMLSKGALPLVPQDSNNEE